METDHQQNLFDTAAPFIVEIRSGGRREAKLRYPSDAQWNARQAAAKVIRTDLGRGKTKTERIHIEAHDLRLFEQQLLEAPAQEFDDFEASLVIDTLAKAEVISSSIEGERITMTLTVFGGVEVTLIFREPRRRQIVEFQRSAINSTNTQKGAETVITLEPSGRLFDSLLVSAAGYAPESIIPIVHKDVAVVEVLRLQVPE